MVVSLKANRKRIIAFLILAAAVIGACIFLWDGGKQEEVREYPGGTGEERVAFLESFGWKVDPEPAESREVMIPAQFNDVYVTYNAMQKAQGFDLKPYAGEVCTQYKYKINNYPNEPEVYATLLVYGDKIIGGDVACSEVNGFMHGFAPDSAHYGEAKAETAPASPGPKQDLSSVPEESCPEESEGAESETDTDPESSPAESTAGEIISEEDYPTD